jgi:two-component system, chemotaxis family, CheB/CheR fusion protein
MRFDPRFMTMVARKSGKILAKKAVKHVSLKLAKERRTSDSAAVSEDRKDGFHIVGIGASAGGLKALESFFSTMPVNCGMSFIVISHLDPKHSSMLPDLLKRYTKIMVDRAQDGIRVERDRIYVIPPNKEMTLVRGTLVVRKPSEPHGQRFPIDTFFRSLARDQKQRAICIILSGTGTDGTLGLRGIKAEGGMAMAQATASAEYDGMPTSAIGTGLVDYILPAEKMPARLVKYVNDPHLKVDPQAVTLAEQPPETMEELFHLLESQTGHGFSSYKKSTIGRRVERRMGAQNIKSLSSYIRFIQRNPAEIHTLFKELLIGVTHFFRDPEAFKSLSQVLSATLKKHPKDSTFRIWTPGCSTGEEPYSLAILLYECMSSLRKYFPAQIFATDIDSQAINLARAGVYSASAVAELTAARLKRFFLKDNGAYRVKKEIRDMLIFAEQDLIRDPAFSKLDLVACRNLLIYLEPELQKQLLHLFHYALKPGGLLFLGTSESIGNFSHLFSPVDKKSKIFRRRNAGAFANEAVGQFLARPLRRGRTEVAPGRAGKDDKGPVITNVTEMKLLEKYTSPSVLINQNGEIVYAFGRTGKYLELAQGHAALSIQEMAHPGIKDALVAAIHESGSQKKRVAVQGLILSPEAELNRIKISVEPLGGKPDGSVEMMVVTFEDIEPIEMKGGTPKRGRATGRGAQLERELKVTREHLKRSIEEAELSNEELKSANEESQSTNEELQSANEELETSKEELQSINEELVTVNAELQGKIEELTVANDDVRNLLDNTNIATIFLDKQLRIKRFTPAATQIVNLIPTDVGRPLSHLVSNLEIPFDTEAKEVLDRLATKEMEVRNNEGRSYLSRIMPYRTVDDLVDGVVITFTDITESKRALVQQEMLEYLKSIVATVRDSLVVLDGDLKVITASRSFYQTFQVQPESTEGVLLYELGDGQWNIPSLRELLEKILATNASFEDFAVEHDFPGIGHKKMLLNARKVYREDIDTGRILLAIEDTTGAL